MTDQEMRVAIAEACGWKVFRTIDKAFDHWEAPNGHKYYGWEVPTSIPNYPNDLNAMHEAEKVFDTATIDVQSKYLDYLYCTIEWDEANNAKCAKHKCYYGSVRATAHQRAEAFLRTVGKWKD